MISLCVLGTFLCVVSMVTSQQLGCHRAFMANAMSCVQNATINFQSLTYLTSNGTIGQPPQEGIEQFRMRACNVRARVDQCGEMVTQTLLNSTMCMNQLERQQVMASSKDIFGGYDRICAHPCRWTLKEEIRQCFTYNNLDPRLFFESFWLKNAIIGLISDTVYQFCVNRQQLMQCLRQKAQICQDSQQVFTEMGMELNSMERGINTLCNFQNVYLSGLGCYMNPSPEVQMCQHNSEMKMQTIKSIQYTQLTNQQFIMQLCSTRLEGSECVINAHTRRQQERCDQAMVGLRTELDCILLPQLCMQFYPHMFQRMCNPMNYHLEERSHYAAAGSLDFAWSTISALLAVAIVSKERF
ncbi:uncharacterized protein LOC121390734 [Gigantopelta aegis]|uniref:uncharacterized protein LOC121390734 n=1 Tax=Gigantopelta aegis TaxID=1735272 RepID=UPI001B88E609|nr:uncharacterized protein LOC121390734 [Gigantopelta aegis]